MDPREQEKAIAALLRKRAAEPGAAATPECPDPKILAAYYERALEPREQAEQDEHVSSCARCQAQLAVMVRSEPQQERKGALAWLFQPRYVWRWIWIAPVAAAAILIAVRPWQTRAPTSQTLELASTAHNEAEKTLGQLQESKPAPQKPPAAAPAPRLRNPARALGAPGAEAAPAGRALSAAADQIAASAEPGPPPSVAQQAQEMAADSSVATAPAPQTAKRAPSAMVRTQMRAGAAGGTVAGANSAVFADRSLDLLIASADPAVRWRAGVAGTIEHTKDGGKTWTGQFADLNVRLLAGSAPTSRICWLVGGAGTILRTTDGEHWQKLPAPSTADLTGVQAQDELRATLRTSDGRAFITRDGGLTWQEIP